MDLREGLELIKRCERRKKDMPDGSVGTGHCCLQLRKRGQEQDGGRAA